MQEGDALEREGAAFVAFALRGLFPLLEKEEGFEERLTVGSG